MPRQSSKRNVKYGPAWIAVAVLLLVIAPGARAQNEVGLLVPNPFRGTLNKLVPGFESKTGYKLKVSYGRGMGTREQIARGEMFDVSILLPPYPEALASGNIDPKSATTLARLVLALGVKTGAPKPDIFTPAALKKALLAARSVAYVDPTIGSDGHATREALEKLGIVGQIAPKTKLAATSRAVANLVTNGDAEICIFYRNEMTEPGIEVVGRLPKQFANPGKVVAFISTHARDTKAARALVNYLSSPEAEAAYKKDGLEPAH